MFAISFHLFALSLALDPSVLGFNSCEPDGRSLNTDVGIVVVTHARWLAALWSVRLFWCSLIVFGSSVLVLTGGALLRGHSRVEEISFETMRVSFFVFVAILIAALLRSIWLRA